MIRGDLTIASSFHSSTDTAAAAAAADDDDGLEDEALAAPAAGDAGVDFIPRLCDLPLYSTYIHGTVVINAPL